MTEPLLAIAGLSRTFEQRRGLLGRAGASVTAVDNVSFVVGRGSTLGVIGESGSGKTTLARMIAGLLQPTSGTIRFGGQPMRTGSLRERREHFRRVQLVFQNSLGSLNPRKTVRQILAQPISGLLRDRPRPHAKRIDELLSLVGLDAGFAERHPHELSGGQAQRIGIARALAAEPELLVLDEPVSSLDVSVQAMILALLVDLQKRLGLTYVFVSHDIALVHAIAANLLVMKDGRAIERGDADAVLKAPQHPFTQRLVACVAMNFTASAAKGAVRIVPKHSR